MMRFTESKIRQIIREEARRVLREATFDLARAIEYTSVVLDDSSHRELADLAPEGWRVYAHHMTVVPPTQQGSGPRWEYSGYRMGDEIELRAVAIARNDRVVAVAVETELPTKASIPHVTIATNPETGGKPKDSNEFSEDDFEPLDEPITLVGVLEEVPRGSLSEAVRNTHGYSIRRVGGIPSPGERPPPKPVSMSPDDVRQMLGLKRR